MPCWKVVCFWPSALAFFFCSPSGPPRAVLDFASGELYFSRSTPSTVYSTPSLPAILVGSGAARAEQLAVLDADSARPDDFVARVSAASTALAGSPVELALDTSKVVLFDADTGRNLTVPS